NYGVVLKYYCFCKSRGVLFGGKGDRNDTPKGY
ncbi:unnamed protein product, partial [marine sediment metagenome]